VEDGLQWLYIRALGMPTHECNEWKAPVIVGGHHRACLKQLVVLGMILCTGKMSSGGRGRGHVSLMGAGRERAIDGEADGGAAGGERCRLGCLSLSRRLILWY